MNSFRTIAIYERENPLLPIYDDAGRITQIVEQPSGDITSCIYGNTGRILSENRTRTKPYTSS